MQKKGLFIMAKKYSYLSLLTAALLWFGLISCQAPHEIENDLFSVEAEEVNIIMRNSLFEPRTVTVEQGATVIWINEDSLIHTVTSGTRGNETSYFDSGNMARGETFSHTFEEIGTFDYFCRPHVGMEGTIEVE